MPTNWRVYKQHTVAAKLDRSDLPGFFRKNVVVGINEAAIVLRDGEPLGIVTEAKVKVAGFFDQFLSVFKAGADISVYFADLSPFDLMIFLGEHNTTAESAQSGSQFSHSQIGEPANAKSVGWLDEQQEQASVSTTSQVDVSQVTVLALSADREVIQASCRIRLQVDTDKVKDFLALVKGKRGLATWDIAALLRDELLAKVLVPELSRQQSSELRGNREIVAKLESQATESLTKTLNSFGLRLEDFSINWGLTEEERAEIAKKRAERQEGALEFAKIRQLAQLARTQEIEKTRLANLQELKVAQATGNEELKRLLLVSDLQRDLLVKDHQVDTALIDGQIREITLKIEKSESLARLEKRKAEEELRMDLEDREFKQKHAARLATLEADDKEMASYVRMQIEMATQKHEREIASRRQEHEAEFRKMQADIEDRYQQRKLKLDESRDRMAMMERLVSQGLSTGQADASVLNTMLQQATEQEYATTSDAKVKYRSRAQAAGNNLETFRTAQADERAHQLGMTQLSADLMAAAKQSPAPIIMPGMPTLPPMGSAPVIIQTPSPNPMDHRQSPHAPAPSSCPSCHQAVQSHWKACPNCGGALRAPQPVCFSCQSPVQAHWKACPACGTGLVNPNR